MIHKAYLAKLISILEATQITKGDKPVDWEQGFEDIIDLFRKARAANRRVYFIGNGGSAAIAEHMLTDFMKNGRVCTINLLGSSLVTCLGNDYGYEYVYEKSLSMLAAADDILVAISSSGNSPNIVNAIRAAADRNVTIITFSGFATDNKIRRLGHYNIYVPIKHYGLVESIHTVLLQQIVDNLTPSLPEA